MSARAYQIKTCPLRQPLHLRRIEEQRHRIMLKGKRYYGHPVYAYWYHRDAKRTARRF